MSGDVSFMEGRVISHRFTPRREDFGTVQEAAVHEYVKVRGGEVVCITFVQSPARPVGTLVEVKILD